MSSTDGGNEIRLKAMDNSDTSYVIRTHENSYALFEPKI